MVIYYVQGLMDMVALNSDKVFVVTVPLMFRLQSFEKNRLSKKPKPQGGNNGGSSLSICARCGRQHDGKFSASTKACLSIVKVVTR